MKQPDKPTEPGVLVKIDGDASKRVWVVVDPHERHGRILRGVGGSQWWTTWEDTKRRAGNRRIIVSTPPRWPETDTTPGAGVVAEERGE